MVDPNETDLALLNSLADIWKWAGVTEALVKEFTKTVGDLPLVREFVLISEADFEEALAQCRDKSLTLVEKTRFRSARRVARIKLGLTPVPEPTLAASPATPVGGAMVPGSPKEVGRRVKLAQVLDQTCDGEIEKIDPSAVRSLYDAYTTERGDPPHPDIEPTADQIAALRQVLKDDGVPYADFAVFGPHGNRLIKRLTFKSFVHQPDGTWRRVELAGPPDFGSWWRCYRTFKTLLLMLGVAKVEHVDNYGEHVRELHEKFGAKCWFLIYQADVRMRSEEFERIRRTLESQHNKFNDTSLSALSDFDPKQPWNAVFKHAASDRSKTFWDREVRDKAFLFLGGLNSADALMDDETAQGKFPNNPEASSSADGQDKTGRRRSRSPGRKRSRSPKKTRPPKSERQDQSRQGPDGSYTHNRRGNEICIKYNRGECSLPCPSRRSHQCNVCLKNDHAATRCPQANPGNADKGKGKGKGGKRH